MTRATLAIDLGTTRVKAGLVSVNEIIWENFFNFPVMCEGRKREVDPKHFFRKLRVLMRQASNVANKNEIEIKDIGITSQAQTFIVLDKRGYPLTNFILWNDYRGTKEAEIIKENLPEFANLSGFMNPLAFHFATKILHLKMNFPEVFENGDKFLLLNEWVIFQLTGVPYGDTTNFGMGGLYNIRKKDFNKQILEFLEVDKRNFSQICEAGSFSLPVRKELKQEINLKNRVKVYSCGNDQTASAIGAGVENGNCLINMGTALVFYLLVRKIPKDLTENQICGIFPFGSYFLLNVESDFGNVLDWARNTFSSSWRRFRSVGGDFWKELGEREKSVKVEYKNGKISFKDVGFRNKREDFLKGVVHYLTGRFKKNLKEIRKYHKKNSFLASGGWSSQENFRNYLESKFSIRIIPVGKNISFHGIRKIVEEGKKHE